MHNIPAYIFCCEWQKGDAPGERRLRPGTFPGNVASPFFSDVLRWSFGLGLVARGFALVLGVSSAENIVLRVCKKTPVLQGVWGNEVGGFFIE